MAHFMGVADCVNCIIFLSESNPHAARYPVGMNIISTIWSSKTYIQISSRGRLLYISPVGCLVVDVTINFTSIYYQHLQVSDLRVSRLSGILENFFEISLLDLESFLFHFSISISSHFYFTFISRKE